MADLNRIAEIRDLPFTAGPTATSVGLGEGSCFLPSGRRIMTAGTSATIPANQAVGWLHAYAYEASNNTLGLELSTTAPDVPYRGTARTKIGDVTRRYLGSGRVEATGRFRSARHLTVGAKGNRIVLDQSTGTFTAPPRLLNLSILALTAPTVQTLNLATVVPPTAVAVDVKVANLSNLTTYFSRPSLGNPSNTNRTVEIAPNATATVTLLLDSDLTLLMLPSATGLLGNLVTIAVGNVVVEVMGYHFNR